jgi:hypothetical protein
MLDPMEPSCPSDARPRALSGAARLLLWDFPRGSLPYDLVVLALLALLFLVPGSFWGDPMMTTSWP